MPIPTDRGYVAVRPDGAGLITIEISSDSAISPDMVFAKYHKISADLLDDSAATGAFTVTADGSRISTSPLDVFCDVLGETPVQVAPVTSMPTG